MTGTRRRLAAAAALAAAVLVAPAGLPRFPGVGAATARAEDAPRPRHPKDLRFGEPSFAFPTPA